jgi:histidyl-tRNA synthetase
MTTNYSTPSGFTEYLPTEQHLYDKVHKVVEDTYKKYGFSHIDTPAVERMEVLTAKGNQGDNIIYAIEPVTPHGEATETDAPKRGLRFDQTVPLAAYVARHKNDLVFPFPRYAIGSVFRGERAKAGRYRQFVQADIDVVGRGSLPLVYDAQMPAIIAEIFEKLHIGDFLIRINNRKVLTGFFDAIGIGAHSVKDCIKIVDELEKIRAAGVISKLEAIGVTAAQAKEIVAFTEIDGSVDEILDRLAHKAAEMGDPAEFCEGIAELTTVIAGVRSLQVPERRYCIDLSIARGLGYYTGTVYETSLLGYPGLGSICSGGRYEDLVGIFTGEKMPGVGISIGLTRLVYKLMDLELLKPTAASPAKVMVFNLHSNLMDTYLKTSQQLRHAGMEVLTSFEQRKIGEQFDYAQRLGIPLCVLIGAREIEAGTAQIAVMETGEKISVPLDRLTDKLHQLLA